MLIGFRPKALTLAELMAIVNPQEARQPEVVPAILYSQRTYLAAGVQSLTFYDATTADPTLDNVSNGSLPSPQFFQEQQSFLTFQRTPTRTAAIATAAGALNDIALVLKTARGLALHSISNKEQYRYRITASGPSGGEIGVINGTYTADVGFQQGNNGWPGHSPFQVNGMVVIPPQTNFTFEIRFQATLVPISADMGLLQELYGALYRRVL